MPRYPALALIAPLLASCATQQPVVVAIVVDGASAVQEPYAATGQVGKIAASCDEIHAYRPELPSGLYFVQPPGSAAPFPVRCEMKRPAAAGRWWAARGPASRASWILAGATGPWRRTASSASSPRTAAIPSGSLPALMGSSVPASAVNTTRS